MSANSMISAPLIMQAKNIVKRYGQVTALDGDDLPAPLSPMTAKISPARSSK